MLKAFTVLQDEFARTGVAKMTFDPAPMYEKLEPCGGHFMGTTRMSVSPSDGVVDTDCRVHGIANLFIASSSVFPTCSHANPTIQMIALALRLGDHLDRISAG